VSGERVVEKNVVPHAVYSSGSASYMQQHRLMLTLDVT